MLLTLLQNNSSGSYVLLADGGSYSYSGNDATLTYTTAGAFTLVADGWTYNYSGNDANLLVNRVLIADGGVYSYTGNNANLLINRVLISDGGVYSYNGNNADLIYTTSGAFVLTAEGGVYSYVGNDANLSFSGVPIVDFDTHDGDRQRRRFAADRDERKRRRKDIIEAFEVLVEGKDPIVEEIVEEFTVAKAKPSVTKPRIDYDKLIKDIDAVERLWNAYIDMDDEEILLLL